MCEIGSQRTHILVLCKICFLLPAWSQQKIPALRYLCMNEHSSTAHNSREREQHKCPSVDEQINGGTSRSGTLLSHKEEQSPGNEKLIGRISSRAVGFLLREIFSLGKATESECRWAGARG